MRGVLPLFLCLGLVLAAPLLLRQPQEGGRQSAEDSVVIISPHDETIRFEFTRAFADYYQRKTGRTVRVDWRLPGGTTEIVRYLDSEFEAAFRAYWTATLHRPWTREVLDSFSNPRVRLDHQRLDDQGPPGETARKVFLSSDAGCGIDLLFGGGTFDFANLADRGFLVDSGVLTRFPELFGSNGDLAIPRVLGGEPYWDEQGRWVGTCLAGFGICYNTDVLARLGVASPPAQWTDLTDARFFKAIALADPTKSGSAAKAFELLIQQQMNQRLSELSEANGNDHGNQPREPLERQAVAEGWQRALQLLIRLAANARYFSDAASKVPLDVAYGDAAAGMCIDFYGRFESEAVADGSGRSRLGYTNVRGGTSVGVDSIALLRGAPHPQVAKAFLDFVLQLEGQKLWDCRPGTPGGPVRYSLRRLPVRKEFYREPLRSFLADREADPYRDARAFQYHEAWTAPLFSSIRFLVRVMCIDSREELVAARRAIGNEPVSSPAFQKLLDVSRVRYDVALQQIRETLRSADRVQEIRLAEELTTYFRNQYRQAERLARERH
ncbi:MAG: extracellular solute-binding protein [Verrucomicrobia bacterium]|nr:extracellular solute-binding protein [Verrucomicrobiota bacterium]